jgi:hypothetical protein
MKDHFVLVDLLIQTNGRTNTRSLSIAKQIKKLANEMRQRVMAYSEVF